MNQKKQKKAMNYLRICMRSIRLAWKFSPSIFGAHFIAKVIQSLMGYVQIGILGLIVDGLIKLTVNQNITSSKDYQTVIWLCVFYVIALATSPLLEKIISYLDTIFFRKFCDYLDLEFIHHVATRDIQIQESADFQNDKSKAQERGSYEVYHNANRSSNFISEFLSVIIGIIYLGNLDIRFAFFALCAAIPSFIISYVYGERVYGMWDEDTDERRLNDKLRRQIQDKNTAIELRLFTNIEYFYKRIVDFVFTFQNKMVNNEKKRVRDEMLMSLISIASLSSVFYIIVQKILQKLMSVGQLSIAFSTFSKLENDINKLFGLVTEITNSARYTENHFKIMDVGNILVQPKNPIQLDYAKPLSIEFKNVFFKYPGMQSEKDAWIFENFNLSIKAGEKIAIVGHNGAGKTTLVHLMLRMYDVDKGQVLINGIDIREIDCDVLYKHSAVLMQDFDEYSFTVREVIALGNTDAIIEEENIIKAAKKSQASMFIEKWEERYDAQIGREFKGKGLSGGETQRMALARVFYRDAKLIILDEPTSAVDAIAEEEIFQSLYNNSEEKTTITVSHRFSTVKRSDRIIVLEGGRVIESGSHAELLSLGGLYTHLYKSQAEAYQD